MQLAQTTRGEAAGGVSPDPFDLGTAGVAHDFNNLLSVIMVCAGEIADGAAERDQRERAEEIRVAARRGAELSRRLIAGDASEEERAPAPIAPEAAIAEALGPIRRTLPGTVDVSLESSGHVPHVRVSPGELERMLVNLAANARDALPGGGSVCVHTALVAVPPGDPVLPTGWCVRIGFSDDGRGMSTEVARRAALPYFTTKHEEGGTGLGLATVGALCRARGGDLRINTTPGAGTTVAIYLPAVRASGQPLTLRRSDG